MWEPSLSHDKETMKLLFSRRKQPKKQLQNKGEGSSFSVEREKYWSSSTYKDNCHYLIEFPEREKNDNNKMSKNKDQGDNNKKVKIENAATFLPETKAIYSNCRFSPWFHLLNMCHKPWHICTVEISTHGGFLLFKSNLCSNIKRNLIYNQSIANVLFPYGV